MEDEISSESTTDIPTVAISYILMLAYVSIALGRVLPLPAPSAPLCSRIMLMFNNTKFLLGLGAIMIVLLSLGPSCFIPIVP